MTGDQQDIQERLRLTLPDHWFGDAPPVLGGVLAGLASLWAGLYALLDVVRAQSRLDTATGDFLDLASQDFFADRLPRLANEADDSFRSRVQQAMRRDRATRPALILAGQQAGYAIRVFEPARPADTGAYGVAASLAWGVSGGWGSLAMPLECLVTATGGPGANAAALRAGLTDTLPAGGVAWLSITNEQRSF